MKTLNNTQRNKLECYKNKFESLDGKIVEKEGKIYKVRATFKRNGFADFKKFYLGGDLKIFIHDANIEVKNFSKRCELIAKVSSNMNEHYSITKLAEDYKNCLLGYEAFITEGIFDEW